MGIGKTIWLILFCLVLLLGAGLNGYGQDSLRIEFRNCDYSKQLFDVVPFVSIGSTKANVVFDTGFLFLERGRYLPERIKYCVFNKKDITNYAENDSLQMKVKAYSYYDTVLYVSIFDTLKIINLRPYNKYHILDEGIVKEKNVPVMVRSKYCNLIGAESYGFWEHAPMVHIYGVPSWKTPYIPSNNWHLMLNSWYIHNILRDDEQFYLNERKDSCENKYVIYPAYSYLTAADLDARNYKFPFMSHDSVNQDTTPLTYNSYRSGNTITEFYPTIILSYKQFVTVNQKIKFIRKLKKELKQEIVCSMRTITPQRVCYKRKKNAYIVIVVEEDSDINIKSYRRICRRLRYSIFKQNVVLPLHEPFNFEYWYDKFSTSNLFKTIKPQVKEVYYEKE